MAQTHERPIKLTGDRLLKARLPEMAGELSPRAERLGNIREHRIEKRQTSRDGPHSHRWHP